MDEREGLEDNLTKFGVSKSDIAALMSNPAWRCMCADMDDRLANNYLLMESAPADDLYGQDAGGNRVLIHVGFKKLQGGTVEIRHFLGFPDRMLEDLKAIQEEDKKER